jgi:hypothetical protein
MVSRACCPWHNHCADYTVSALQEGSMWYKVYPHDTWTFFRCCRKIAKSDYFLRHVSLSVCPSAWSTSTVSEWIFMKFVTRVFFGNLWRKFKFHWNMKGIRRILHEDLCTFMIVSRWIHLRMRIFSDKIIEKIKIHILFSKLFFRKSCRLWDNVEKSL